MSGKGLDYIRASIIENVVDVFNAYKEFDDLSNMCEMLEELDILIKLLDNYHHIDSSIEKLRSQLQLMDFTIKNESIDDYSTYTIVQIMVKTL